MFDQGAILIAARFWPPLSFVARSRKARQEMTNHNRAAKD
jgi:hypothetical protein